MFSQVKPVAQTALHLIGVPFFVQFPVGRQDVFLYKGRLFPGDGIEETLQQVLELSDRKS